MQPDGSIGIRCFVGWVALVVGSLLGWALVEMGWRHVNSGMHWHLRPERGWGYVVLAIVCAISVGVVGMSMVRFRDLPGADADDQPPG
jgi:ABC-type antimicrobial peptide transport system permease subunit